MLLSDVIISLSDEVRASLPAVLGVSEVEFLINDTPHEAPPTDPSPSPLKSPWGKKYQNKIFGGQKSPGGKYNKSPGAPQITDSPLRSRSPGGLGNSYSQNNSQYSQNGQNNQNTQNNQSSQNGQNSTYSNMNQNRNSNASSSSSNNGYTDIGGGYYTRDVTVPINVTYPQYGTGSQDIEYVLRLTIDSNDVNTDIRINRHIDTGSLESDRDWVQDPLKEPYYLRQKRESTTFSSVVSGSESILDQIVESITQILDLCAESQLASEELAAARKFR